MRYGEAAYNGVRGSGLPGCFRPPRRKQPGRPSPFAGAGPSWLVAQFPAPLKALIGAPGEGWRIAMSTAGNERGLMLRS
ncbi:hypothetical protein ACWDAG_40325, partial [Streptomyces sp. NPDC001157]